jgi:hypothetical protein
VSAPRPLNSCMVGDTDTGRAQDAVGLLISGSGVIRSVTQCGTASVAKR